MKDTQIQIMGDTEYKICRILHSLGLSEVTSRVLACLSKMHEMDSRGLEIAANIRQTDVSAAMRILHDNNWIAERAVKKNTGVGRPVKCYKLSVTVEEIINTIEAAKREDFKNIIADIELLRELVKSE